jgi:Pyruvate/2-oxoacid:ferredoxin oxidoreductase delta subunit
MTSPRRPRIILSGHKTPESLDAFERDVADRCLQAGFDCLLIPHLYHLPESSELWDVLADRMRGAVLLCWLHPRPAEWLLRRHEIVDQPLAIHNLAAFADSDAALAEILSSVPKLPKSPKASATAKTRTGKIEHLGGPSGERWYPVVDDSRCANCGHCLQFCLFGVYELDTEKRVAVCQPDQCKPGCPACSRICPQSAIMFPLYEKDAAIAGAPGQLVTLDAAAKKTFYARTGRPCPQCGQVATQGRRRKKTSGPSPSICPECGQPRDGDARRPPARQTAAPLPFDDLDELVDQLDRQMQRRR